jgi:hypothetical protein
MDDLMKGWLSGLTMGEIQQHESLALVPLFVREERGPAYLTLSEALETHVLSVTELGDGGSVPELKVANKGDACVLLLDGEELAGAKQNRVLNTTTLLKPQSETVIPVSCTEHGRWSAVSAEFRDSGVVMNARSRRRKTARVSGAMAAVGAARSDQGEVWGDIAELAADMGVQAATGAMRDVFAKAEGDLNAYLGAFPCLPGQHGILALIGDAVVGFDLLSRSSAYARLHPKLVRSVALDALRERHRSCDYPPIARAAAFIEDAIACEQQQYPSVGLGQDLRFQSARVVGSALLVDETPVHCALFPALNSDQADPMASYRQRRGFRGGR